MKRLDLLCSVCAELGSSVVGIEKHGYVEGAVFVLVPSVDEWMDVLSQPLPEQLTGPTGRVVRKKQKTQPEDSFASLALRAVYKGYGPWRVSDAITEH